MSPVRGADDSPSIRAEFLFQSGDTAYFRCDQAIGPYDSVAADGYSELINVDPPLWMVRTLPGYAVPDMGATVYFHHIERPRIAAQLSLVCKSDPWDPLKSTGVSAWVGGAMFQRTLFDLDATSPPGGALAVSYSWRGRDLVVVVDTSARFAGTMPVTSYDVKSSLERYLWYRRNTPEYSWDRAIAGVEAYRSGRTDHVVGLIPRSADTLQFNLQRPCYSLPGRLSAPSTAIVAWRIQDNESVVGAVAGYYSRWEHLMRRGTGEHGGGLLLNIEPASEYVVLGQVTDTLSAIHKLALPELLVVRPGGNARPELLTFIDFALDRSAMASIVCKSRAQFPPGLLPVAELVAGDGAVNMDEAVAARETVPGKPVVRVAAQPGYESAAGYLVTALKAWEFKAVSVPPGEVYDLRLEDWTFDSFDDDELAEGIMAHLGYAATDSLVARLWSARAEPDDDARNIAYRSLFARLADRAPYVVVYQRVGEYLFDRDRYEADVNRWGCPVGPIFERENK